MVIALGLLALLVAAALWTVMTSRILRAAVGLALVSVVLAVLMFQLGSPLAAVFELSICAGLISVIFFVAISFTHTFTRQEGPAAARQHLRRFWPLPVILGALAIVMGLVTIPLVLRLPAPAAPADVRTVLWSTRHVDLLGQIIILLAGALGIVVLFKKGRT